MDGRDFDAWLRSLTESRRSLLGGLLVAVTGWGLAGDASLAKHKGKGKGKKKKHKKQPPETCGPVSCSGGQLCCDDRSGLCCGGDAECCNPGAGTGSCCPAPGHCAPIFGGDSTYICCPPQRIFQTSVGLNECCPAGEVATGGVTTSGPCCPEDRLCGDDCCPSGSTCIGEECCPNELVGDFGGGDLYCCSTPGETVPCNGQCCQTGAVCCGGVYCCGLNGFICKSGCTNDPSGTGFACCHQDSQFCCLEGS